MKPISLQQALCWINGATLYSRVHVPLTTTCSGINTDTRTLQSNHVFVALKGEQFDGHRFIDFAARQQAMAAVVSYDNQAMAVKGAGNMPLIFVPDTAKALQEIAQGYRQQFHLPLTVVVGSNGKTTTKEMIHSIFKMHLSAQGNVRKSHSTAGNFNNDIGLPLTLLTLNEHHALSVIELGMNHPGETATLARVAAPTIAIINNAQREHQEFMHTVEAVAQEHAAVIPALVKEGTVVIPAQDAYVQIWRDSAAKHHKKVIDFALHVADDKTPAIVTGCVLVAHDPHRVLHAAQTLSITTPLGKAVVGLSIAGQHHARNALAATSVALAAGIPLPSIVLGLQAFEPVKGRMQQHVVVLGSQTIHLIDDTYNANPDSVVAAINVLNASHRRKVLVLGDMGEVGDQGEMFHIEAGTQAALANIDVFYTTGQLMQYAHAAFKAHPYALNKLARHFESAVDLQAAVLSEGVLCADDLVLVKGSRFMRMESIVNALRGTLDINTVGVH
jgi:UDP-N-acetylmuramoyl-tripeptide--D-alanyl-D-alanine ligase